MAGKISLVGTGPGAPDLLTIRALRALSNADVVIYDPDVALDIVSLASGSAEVLPTSRFGASPEAQERVYSFIVDRALAGKHVVRLKDGDPMVFSGGGQEWLFLAERGLPVDCIPGVSAAIGIPEMAGIPVTCRGLSTGFAVVSGTAGADEAQIPTDFSAYAAIDTLVVLMGVERRATIAEELIQAGRDPGEPVIFIERGCSRTEHVVESTLGAVACGATAVSAPAVFVIGEVVKLRDTLHLPTPLSAFQ